MYDQLNAMLAEAAHIYGPVTKEQAFDVPVHSWACEYNNQWFIGTVEPLENYASLEVLPS